MKTTTKEEKKNMSTILSHTNTNINQLLFNVPDAIAKSDLFLAKQHEFLHGMHKAADSIEMASMVDLRSLPHAPEAIDRVLRLVCFILQAEQKHLNTEQFPSKEDRTWQKLVRPTVADGRAFVQRLKNFAVGASFTRDVYEEILDDWKYIKLLFGREEMKRFVSATVHCFDWLECVIDYYELAMLNSSKDGHNNHHH